MHTCAYLEDESNI